MINISGFLDKSEANIFNTQDHFQVNSCGHYRLLRLKRFETVRERGRSDFQLLYVAQGKASFLMDGEMHDIQEGSVVLYYPHTPQKYSYQLSDLPDIYWLHFSGADAPQLLKNCGFDHSGAYAVGIKPEYGFLCDKIIEELQLKRSNFYELCAVHLQELFHLMARQIAESGAPLPREEIQKAAQYFNRNFRNEICISDYAKSCGMSVAWFIRSFKEHMGVTPGRYLTGIRMNKAKDLLSSPSLNITEIAALVGYQNPLYFSRLFKQTTGFSPLEYRKRK